jgi:CelD/BcsL family acetyltransferase involved in cellulose biosynthesis
VIEMPALALGDGPAPTVEVVRDLDSVASEWEALAGRLGAAPWQWPGWARAWWRAFGHGRPELLTVRRGARLTGVLPLARCRHGVLVSQANWHTPEFGPLAEPDDLRALAAELVSSSHDWFSLRFLDPASAGYRECRAAAAGAGLELFARILARSPYVDTTGTWEAYESRLHRHLLHDLRRRRRRLEQLGKVELEVSDGRERLDELLAEGFRVEASGWKADRGTAIASHAQTTAFYTDVARWAAGRGWLRLAFLRVDTTSLAFDFALEADGVHYVLKTGFDSEHASYSPGKQLRLLMLQRAFALGARSYELLGDEEPWKRDWTDAARERVELQGFAPTRVGRLAHALIVGGRRAEDHVLALRRG